MSNGTIIVDKAHRRLSAEARARMGGSTRFKAKHGMRNYPEYSVWRDMINRCRNPNVHSYPHYGGRGISVCERWHTFANFYADLGLRPDGYSLERIDIAGNYEPHNVKWIPLALQQRNKRNSRRITYDGVTDTLAAWSERTGIKQSTIDKRIKRGWSIQRALS